MMLQVSLVRGGYGQEHHSRPHYGCNKLYSNHNCNHNSDHNFDLNSNHYNLFHIILKGPNQTRDRDGDNDRVWRY